MSVTITITDPTAPEARALQAYLTSLTGATPVHSGAGGALPKGFVAANGDSGPELFIPNASGHILPPQAHERIAVQHTERAGAVEVRQTIYESVTAEDAGAPDFDSSGYPWDERIHAGSHATVADGTWRKKRGVSDEYVAEVEAELRKLDAEIDEFVAESIPAPEQEQSVPDVPNAPEQEQEVPETPVPEHITAEDMAEADANAADAPEVPSPVPAPPVDQPNPFLAVMSRIGKSKLDKAKKDELLTAAGALDDKGNPSILVLNKRPELIEGFVALLDSEGV